MRKRHLDLTDNKIWKDKRVPIETKHIYCYIYSKGFDKIVTSLKVGEIQSIINIKNKGLRKSLQILENLNYLVYREYDNGLYSITLN